MNGMKNMRVSLTVLTFISCLWTAYCGTHPDGVSQVSREQDALGNYKFSYSVSNIEGEHFRKEGTDHLGRIIGSYGLTHNDGTQRVVDYIADKDGFRAEVRSNEPGVASAESADASVVKLQTNLPLEVAATSIDNSGRRFGTRLKTDTSRVSYVSQEKDSSDQKQVDNSARESRQSSFDDYRPQSPVAYYPGSAIEVVRPLNAPSRVSADVSQRTSRQQTPSVESRPLDVYLPPINPHNVMRRPPFFESGDRQTDRYTTTSRRPFTPPYGGFDDDPPPVPRRPGVSMSTIHGGLGTDNFRPPTPSPAYGAGRYPVADLPLSRDFPRSRFPAPSNLPSSPRLPGSILPTGPRSIPPTFFGPPSYDTPRRPANFVLRAVPIPNGIQAVRVDPETGRVYERLMYPMYLGQDGHPEYDKNILLHNDDISDDDAIRNDNPAYLDYPFRRRPPFRSARAPPFSSDDAFSNRTRIFNQDFVDPLTLSIPTARELAWVQRQLSSVEGFARAGPPNRSFLRNTRFENSEYPLFNDFDDSSDGRSDSEDSAYSRSQNSDTAADGALSRNPRLFDRLTPEDSKAIIVSEAKDTELDTEPAATDTKSTAVEKE